jgi:CDP-diacylglycerol--glycerol-3-phosphate 3-phosphatidyltransferase
MWVATVVVLVREWSVTLLRLSVAKHVVMAASRSGKIKTTLQALALGFLILPFRALDGSWDLLGEVLYGISLLLLAGAVAMTLWSGWEFLRDVRGHQRVRRAADR